MVDNSERCGGLLMAREISGSQAWQLKVPMKKLTVGWRNLKLLTTLIASFLFCLLAVYLPVPQTLQAPGPLQIGKVLNKIEEKIDTLESLDMLEEKRAELFRQELEELEKSKTDETPAVTWEAIDQLTESIAAKANEEVENLQNKLAQQSAMNEMVDAVVESWDEASAEKDIAAAAAAELADLINSDALTPELRNSLQQAMPGLSSSNSLNSATLTKEDMKKLSDALSSLSAEEMAKLREMLEAGLMNSSQMQAAQNARMMTAEELREMLEQQCKNSSCTNGCSNLSACLAVSAQGVCPGASGDKPGRGGISHGPGHAALTFSGNTEESGYRFKLQALPKGSPRFNQNKLIGISAAAPEINTENSQSSGGTLDSKSASGASAISTTLLPQHRGVVRNYFSRKTDPKKPTKE